MSRAAPVLLVPLLGLALSACAGFAAAAPEGGGSGPDRASAGGAGAASQRPGEPGPGRDDRGPASDARTASGTAAPTRSGPDLGSGPDQGSGPNQGSGPALEDLLGSDGRLTVLLLGSDARKGIIGERTDAIIVATVDPGSGRVVMASLPRDTVGLPIGPDRVHAERINTLYWDYVRAGNEPREALRRTRKALEYAFDAEIDYYALVDFGGFVKLIDAVGGIDLTLHEPLVDPTMHVGSEGLRLKAGTRHLDGRQALAFTRSRHADTDYDRSRRQHQVIAAAARAVRARGASALPALVELVGTKVVTDMPPSAAPALLGLAGRARIDEMKSVVLAPGRFAQPGPILYTIAPRVVEVRKLFARAFGPPDAGP